MANPQDDAQIAADQAQYSDAFNEIEPTSANPEGGLDMPKEAVESAQEDDGNGPGKAEIQGRPVEPESGAEGVEQTPTANTAATPYPVDDDKQEQRLKSWEGRLRKMEEELNSRKKSNPDEASEDLEKAGEKAASSGDTTLGDAAKEAAAQVEDGTLTAAQAMKQLAEDFGEDFVKLIETVVSAKASEVGKRTAADSMGQVDQKVQSIISHITDANERSHFERIANAVPDFDDIRQDPGFAKFIEAGGQARQSTAEKGEAKDVIKLLKEFKASVQAPLEAAKPKPVNQASADAATGVRSGAMSLPSEPAASDDFEGAWNEAAKSK